MVVLDHQAAIVCHWKNGFIVLRVEMILVLHRMDVVNPIRLQTIVGADLHPRIVMIDAAASTTVMVIIRRMGTVIIAVNVIVVE